MKVLIIDDDIVVHEISGRLLEIADQDCTIVSSFNGRQAVEFLGKQIEQAQILPDVILLDMKMPILDGWGFLEEIQSLNFKVGYSPAIYILSDESYELLGEEKFPIKGGFIKPLNFTAINQIIRQASA